MRDSVGACGHRCSALARAEGRACELEAFVLGEIEHAEADYDGGGEVEGGEAERPPVVIGGRRT